MSLDNRHLSNSDTNQSTIDKGSDDENYELQVLRHLRDTEGSEKIITILGLLGETYIVLKIFDFPNEEVAIEAEKRLRDLATYEHKALVKYNAVYSKSETEICVESEVVQFSNLKKYLKEWSHSKIPEKIISFWV